MQKTKSKEPSVFLTRRKKIIIIMRENLHVFTNGLRSPHPQHTTIYPLSPFLYES